MPNQFSRASGAQALMVFILSAGSVMVSACSHAPTPQLPHMSVAPTTSGAVSGHFLYDPSAPNVHLGPGEEFVPAQMYPKPPPEYPSALLPLGLGKHTIAARVFFDDDGALCYIIQSPLAQSTEDGYTPQFFDAVREAATQWKCWPPEIRRYKPGPIGKDGKPEYPIMEAHEFLQTYFDVTFSFEVVNGKPIIVRAP